jgi:hypothetical protein
MNDARILFLLRTIHRGYPMLNRREFFAGACCLLHAGPAFAQTRRKPRRAPKFICAATPPDYAPASEPEPQEEVLDGKGRPFPRLFGSTMSRGERWLPEDGSTPQTGVITLNVHFMAGTAEQQYDVWQIASEWLRGGLEKKVRFVFGTSRSRSPIRIAFDPEKPCSSEVGREALKIARYEATMNLSEVTRRSILHEFGHVLGLRHEHHHPDAPIRWNKGAVVEDLKKNYGKPNYDWQKYAEEEIFVKFTESHSCNGSSFDPDSIMVYPFDKSWTLDGFGTKKNENISRGDRNCLARMYQA